MMLRPVILAMHLDNKLMGSHNFLSVSSLCDKRVDQLKKAYSGTTDRLKVLYYIIQRVHNDF